MPSNYTENYDLSQWEPEDAVLRTDFNEDNAKIDAALAALESAVTKQESSLSSHTSSIAKLGNCQIYTTSYSGNGGSNKSLSFSGYPVFVAVYAADAAEHLFLGRGGTRLMGDPGNVTTIVTWSTQSVSWAYTTSASPCLLNRSGGQYLVIALLDKTK